MSRGRIGAGIHDMPQTPNFVRPFLLYLGPAVILMFLNFGRMRREQEGIRGRWIGLQDLFDSNFTPAGIRYRNRYIFYLLAVVVGGPVLSLALAYLERRSGS